MIFVIESLRRLKRFSHQLYEQRMTLFINTASPLRCHPRYEVMRDALGLIGANGMSDDEDDSGISNVRVIKVPTWRAPTVTKWLRVLDSMHDTWLAGRGPRGITATTLASNRVQGSQLDHRRAPIGLARAAYNPDFLDNLSETQRQEVLEGSDRSKFDFSVDRDLLR